LEPWVNRERGSEGRGGVGGGGTILTNCLKRGGTTLHRLGKNCLMGGWQVLCHHDGSASRFQGVSTVKKSETTLLSYLEIEKERGGGEATGGLALRIKTGGVGRKAI